jgi:hypothetical protein
MGMLDQLMQMMAVKGQPSQSGIGQVRLPNTIELRNLYGKAQMEAQMSGQQLPPFEVWVQQNFPGQKILNQQPPGLLGQ